MLNLGSKTSTSSQIVSIPSNFRNHFVDLHVVVFIKNDRLTISIPIILNINQWRHYHLKKGRMDNQIYMTELSTSLFFLKLLLEVKKIDVRLNKNLEIKVLGDVFWWCLPDTSFRHCNYVYNVSPILLVETLLK